MVEMQTLLRLEMQLVCRLSEIGFAASMFRDPAKLRIGFPWLWPIALNIPTWSPLVISLSCAVHSSCSDMLFGVIKVLRATRLGIFVPQSCASYSPTNTTVLWNRCGIQIEGVRALRHQCSPVVSKTAAVSLDSLIFVPVGYHHSDSFERQNVTFHHHQDHASCVGHRNHLGLSLCSYRSNPRTKQSVRSWSYPCYRTRDWQGQFREAGYLYEEQHKRVQDLEEQHKLGQELERCCPLAAVRSLGDQFSRIRHKLIDDI